MFPLKTILHPTDFSEPSEYAFRVACSLARDHGAHLFLAHVAAPPMMVGEMVPPPPPVDYKELLWDSFHRLEESEPYIREIHVQSRILDGEPVKEILRLAEEIDCDLIVMGTHGRTGLMRLLMGSVAEQVMRKAPCPVLTVKSLRRAAAEPVLAGAREVAQGADF